MKLQAARNPQGSSKDATMKLREARKPHAARKLQAARKSQASSNEAIMKLQAARKPQAAARKP